MRSKVKIHNGVLGLLSAAIIFMASCKAEQIVPGKEPVKDVSGSWKVIKATRNGTDITAIADFTQFRLNFANGKYTLANKLPFLVTQNGAYSLDDPKYPFQITFTPDGGNAVATAFNFPIVNGNRQLSLTFSPGCPNNTYVYIFQKTN